MIFALLTWPQLASAPLRAIATASGVSLGQARETVMLLQSAGYLDGARERCLRRTSELLERWTAAFPIGIGSPSKQQAFFGDITDLGAPADTSLFVSGESATTEHHRPETLTLYATEPIGKVAALNRWRSDRDANIFIRPKFWSDPLGEPQPGTVSAAPATLIYADLRASGDGRELEAADWIRNRDDRLREL